MKDVDVHLQGFQQERGKGRARYHSKAILHRHKKHRNKRCEYNQSSLKEGLKRGAHSSGCKLELACHLRACSSIVEIIAVICKYERMKGPL